MTNYTVVIEPDEDMYHAYVLALPGCHTFGSTLDETLQYIKEAISLYIDGLIENGEPIPTESESLVVTRVPAAV
ncbi:MAG: type II toxin-antitoxin system HicB family antitoxin [Chloroflexi bacterium]|nr:type II toxin-antitoxin system HicB family antitoxin [Ardenticatenaceae bacterium]MBL1129118.1 type II toxin-antitoxin system HicB family antitoxin [Chloroflexota bacterium]NOG35197.1 type II toxin-antitoxin system HicB family antitoxin [Chloroflexota bacterium]GIK54537.1 MAG: hypothetical protein BroJett015_02000 [Chloroflexota bacterium]